MRAAVAARYGPPEVVEIALVPVPTPSRGELVVREHEQDTSAIVMLRVDNVVPAGLADESEWRERYEHSVSEVATLASVYLAQGVAVVGLGGLVGTDVDARQFGGQTAGCGEQKMT